MKTTKLMFVVAMGISMAANAIAQEARTGQTATPNSARFCAKREAKRLYEGQIRSAPVRSSQKAVRASG